MTIGILILAYLLFGMICFIAVASVRKILLFISLGSGLLALGIHGTWMVERGLRAGYWPFTNTYETLVLLAFLIIVIFFLTFRRYQMLVIGGFAGIIASIVLALASFFPSEIEPLIPALKSNWLLFHVVSSFIGYSAFGLACAPAAVYLGLDLFSGIFRWRELKEKSKQKEVFVRLDWLTCRFIAVGFPFLILGIVTGAIWANASWGRYWNWDPKESWAFITALVYAICLHMGRDEVSARRWRAFVTLFGFATVAFTYFGVNLWLSSLHAYG